MIEYNKEIRLSIDKSNGYQYFCDKTHPLARKRGMVYLHRHVASIREGRWINKSEHVHHIDGNPINNDPSNLKICSKSEHMHIHYGNVGERLYVCPTCGKEYNAYKKSLKHCSTTCAKTARRKVARPSKEELRDMVWSKPTSTLSMELGVSDNAITKWCKQYGINKPGNKHWAKIRATR